MRQWAKLVPVSILFLASCLGSKAWSLKQSAQAAPAANTDAAAKTAPVHASSQSVEHWDVLPIAGNALQASPPALGEKDTLPSFSRELLSVQWRAADPIDLYIIRPNDVVKPPVVIFLYSYPSDTDKFRNDAWCQNVVKHGFAAVGFVSALTGHRYHDRPMKEWFVSELQESLATSVHDVQMVINYLATRDDLDMKRIGMFGQGSGGTIAILSAAVDTRIKAVDVMDPWGDWPDWLAKSSQIPEDERATYLKPDFLAKVASLDPIRLMPRLKGRPFRVQENLFNPVMPESVRKQIEAIASGTAQTVEYHDISEYREKVSANGKMLEWIQGALPAPSQPMSTR